MAIRVKTDSKLNFIESVGSKDFVGFWRMLGQYEHQAAWLCGGEFL
jgi:hypothetical protein